jgi:hypothetical protein
MERPQTNLVFRRKSGDIPRMITVKADDRRRVKLPDTKPGPVYVYELFGEVVKLTPVKPVGPKPMKARVEKQRGYTVVVTDRPVDESVIKELAADFP